MGMDLVLSLLVLTTLALIVGAFYLRRRTGEWMRPLLMLVLAAIMAINVAIWTVPGSSGEAPVAADLR